MGNELSQLSASDVAEHVGRIGKSYQEYALTIMDDGVDGKTLLFLSHNEKNIDDLLNSLGVEKFSHRGRLKSELSLAASSSANRLQSQLPTEKPTPSSPLFSRRLPLPFLTLTSFFYCS